MPDISCSCSGSIAGVGDINRQLAPAVVDGDVERADDDEIVGGGEPGELRVGLMPHGFDLEPADRLPRGRKLLQRGFDDRAASI